MTLINGNTKDKLALSLILFVGFLLRVSGISFRSFFADEVFVVRAIQNPLSSLFAIDAPHGPLPFYILHFWSKIFGLSEFWMRMPSVILGVLTCYLIYKITVELVDKKTALIAAAIAALSPFLILYDQTARWYSLFMLAGTASVYFFMRYMKTNRIYPLLLYFISTLALLHIESIALFIIFFEVLTAIFYFKKWTSKLAATFSALSLLCIPWIMVLVPSFQRVIPANFAERGVAGGVLYKAGYLLYSFTVGQTISPFNLLISLPAAGLFFILALFGLIKIWQKNRPTAIFLLLFMAATMAQVFTQVNLPHYMMHAAIPLIILISIGINELRPIAFKWIAVAAILIIYGYSLFNLYTGQQYNRMEFMDDWKGVALYVRDISDNEYLIIHSNDSFAYYNKDRKNTVLYGNDLQEAKDAVIGYFKTRPSGKVVLVYSPLSGLFVRDQNTGQSLKEWLEQNYSPVKKRAFGKDPDYLSKREHVNRSFPEFRISVSSYSKNRDRSK